MRHLGGRPNQIFRSFSFRGGLSTSWHAEAKRAARAGSPSGRLSIIECADWLYGNGLANIPAQAGYVRT
jgi:hypothetical protein